MLKLSGKSLTLFLLSFALIVYPQGAASTEADVQAKIRKEALENNQAMKTLHVLTDVYGPRLTGSPNHKAAAEWAIKQMQSWGFEIGHLEPWDFGHPGWLNERVIAHVTAPFKEPLVCEVLAWSPSTNGTVTGAAYQLILPDNATAESLAEFFATQQDKVKGKIVLVGKHTPVPVRFTPTNLRLSDEMLAMRMSGNFGGTNRGPQNPAAAANTTAPPQPARLTPAQLAERVDEFLLKNGAIVRVNDGGREHRQIRAFNNRSFDPSKVVPTVIITNEDYGRITRVLADGMNVELEFNIVNRNYPEGRTSYNAIAEIPGTDKRDEVIMLGGHLDSWHSSTGATDNAIGCATMMEAARILKAIGVKPRRTIRVALWSGEEQGLLGSLAYVKEHFGTAENPKPEFAKFGGYFNIDMGTGKARGLSIFGPDEAGASLREVLKPFAENGFAGVSMTKSRATGGSDHTSFNHAGLPGISVMQDPIEYQSHTWHTNLDSYERIVEDDVKKSAMLIASALYHLAMRDELLPRFAKEQMPAPRPVTD